jgi:dihydrofolate reductase
MLLSIVVAAAQNDVIGDRNALPWRLPDDLKRFKAITLGKPVLMGRRTFESIGKPLPGRSNIVISRQAGLQIDGCVAVNSIDQALVAAGSAPEVMVIGGAELYRQILPRTDVIYLTRVHAEIAGDTQFPHVVWDDWIELESEYHPADERHAHAFTFLKLARSYVV